MVFSVFGKDSSTNEPGLNRASVKGKASAALPLISQGLDSVRTYQWEFQLDLPANNAFTVDEHKKVTLAAKQISGFGYKFDDIEVHRINDKVFYPGKINQDELTVTFDNLLSTNMGVLFYKYLSTVYNQGTGYFDAGSNQVVGAGVGSYKTSARILEFDGGGNIQTVYDFKGLYPKGFSKSEKNYSTNEFDTIEVKFRWDFINIQKGSTASENDDLFK